MIVVRIKECLEGLVGLAVRLDHAGLTESQVTELKTELDTDSLTAHYDVEFKCGGFEYEYKINAKSGKVISFEKERD